MWESSDRLMKKTQMKMMPRQSLALVQAEDRIKLQEPCGVLDLDRQQHRLIKTPGAKGLCKLQTQPGVLDLDNGRPKLR
jgi:hypothetical protein